MSYIIAQNGFTTYTTNVSITGTIKYQTALLVDANNDKWIGYRTFGSTANGGLMKYENVTGIWKFYNFTSSPALTSNWVTALVKDNSGNIWIGTDSALYKFNGTTFIRYTTTDGLSANKINCLETSGSNVFIGTNVGMSIFDGTNFTNFNVANGKLPNDNIMVIKAETPSLIWLNGMNSITQFNIMSSLSNTSYSIKNFPSGGAVSAIHIDALNNKWVACGNIILLYDGISFTDINDKYDVVGNISLVKDFATGPHNGVVFKFSHNGLQTGIAPVGFGLMEITSEGKQYQYVKSVTEFTLLGDFISSYGGKIYITAYNYTYGNIPNIFYEFDNNNYAVPYGLVTGDNYKFLDANKVKAGIANRSDMHWGVGVYGNASYAVPKRTVKTSPNSNYATALWIGGYDNSNQLHLGAQTYRQNGNDFWPGPLDTISAGIDTLTSSKYDKIWKVSYTDINDFINNYNWGNVQNHSYLPTEAIMTWPAHGTGNNSKNLAPFVDHNGDGLYDPYDGDYPKIKGDQALYFIYNDNLGAHQNTGALPMGVEVQAMAYAYGCSGSITGKPELDVTTFYDYKIINRSANNYHDVFLSLWSDVDLGYYGDDFIGCNVADNYGYAYNGDNFDDTHGSTNGYGSYPPAQGFALMKGPKANASDGIDNDNDGLIDESGEECMMNKFTYYGNNIGTIPSPETSIPIYPKQYYNYMSGLWADTTSFTCGGSAYGGTVPASWVYSGDPNNAGINTDPSSICGYWNDSGTGGDRRLILGTGPFTLNAGQMQEVEYAFVTSFDSSVANNNIISVAKLKTDVQKVRAFYNQINKPNCFLALGIDEIVKADDFMVFPNPSDNLVHITTQTEGITTIKYELLDVIGKQILKKETKENQFTINVDNLAAGIYFLRIETNKGAVVKKIVRE